MGNDAQKELLARAKKIVKERERCLTDKLYLANEILGCNFQEEVHAELFEQFLKLGGSEPFFHLDTIKNRLILWPRGHYKSTAATVEIIQIILNNPDVTIVIMRSTVSITQTWLNEILSHFTGEAEGSRLAELFPEFCGTRKILKATAGHFTVPCRKRKQIPQATVTVVSSTSNKASQHWDVGLFDDLVTETNFGNENQLEKVNKGFNMCIPLINPGGYTYLIGTRYAINDLYGEKMRKATDATWIISVKTCWLDDDPERGVRFPQRTITRSDGSTKVVGFTAEGLQQICEADPGMFSSQYLNRPVLEATQSFTEDQLTAATIDPATAPDLSTACLFIDIASTTNKHSDDCVILAGKLDAVANMYVVDIRGDKWEPEQFALNILDMVVKHRPNKVLFEQTASTKFFIATLKMVAESKGVHVPVDFFKYDGNADAKAIRIKGLSVYMNRGRLRFFRGLPCWDKLKKQFINFSGLRGNHDDYPDTVALMASFFSGHAPPPPPPASKNLMISIFLRDEEAERLKAFQEATCGDSDGVMGSDFCC